MNASVKLLEQRCPSCNAPLQVSPSEAVVTCRYCGNSISIQRQKAPSGVPNVSSFGAPGHVPSTVLYIPSASVGAASFLPALIPLFIFLVIGIGGAVSALGRRFVSLPATCRPNETLTISGKTFDGTQPAIVAGVNCKITIKDSTLTSTDAIVKGGINLELRIVNSKLKSKTHAIDLASTNAKVWISDKSEIRGDEVGIFGENNVELEVKDSTVSGGQDGIDLGSNGKVTLTDAKIVGKEHGIKAGSSAKVTSKNTTITADESGVRLESSSGSFDGRSTTIAAGDVALFLESNGDVKLADKSVLKASKGDGIVTKSTNLKLQLEDTKVEAREVGLRLSGNADVRLRKGAMVHGDAGGLRSDYNLKLSVEGATIDSAGPAVAGTSNAEVRVTTGSSVKGTPAFQFSSNPSRFDVPDGTFTGEKQLDSRSAGAASPGSDMALRRIIEASYVLAKTCKDGKGGEVRVRIEIAASGKVQSVTSTSSTASKAAEQCVLAKVRSLSFPPRSGTATIQTNYLL